MNTFIPSIRTNTIMTISSNSSNDATCRINPSGTDPSSIGSHNNNTTTKKHTKTTAKDNDCVNVKSRTEYYDNDTILSKWGFTDSQCHCCGKRNSDLQGLLMQCAKCKKAYYCSMKCFNDHLPEHQKFCTTKEIYTEPKGMKSPFEFAKDQPPIIETFTDSNTKIHFDSNNNHSNYHQQNGRCAEHTTGNDGTVVGNNSNDEEVDESVSEYESITHLIIQNDGINNNSSNNGGADGDTNENDDDNDFTEYTEASLENEMNEDDAMNLLQCSMKSLTVPDVMKQRNKHNINNTNNFHHTFSEFGRTHHTTAAGHKNIADGPVLKSASRRQRGFDSEIDDWKMEEVDLRHAEQIKNHYSWSTPDWVMDSKLRSTPRGQVLKNGMGDIVSPVTHAKVLIDTGIIAWEIPDWTNAKLRKTPRGEQIKRTTTTTTTD